VLELKILYHNLENTIEKGLSQTADYADTCGADEAHLLIFDRHSDKIWDDKIWYRPQCKIGNRMIDVWGM